MDNDAIPFIIPERRCWFALDDNNKPIDLGSDFANIKWLHENSHRKRVDLFIHDPTKTIVSTVFLGLNHNFDGGQPILWETMVSSPTLDNWYKRYTSYEEAKQGHDFVVQKVKDNFNGKVE